VLSVGSYLQKPFERLDTTESALALLKPGVNENMLIKEHG
jgi:hypothetical protein